MTSGGLCRIFEALQFISDQYGRGENVQEELKAFQTSKGTIRFLWTSLHRPLW
jgi:hypothetical protein